MKKLAFIFLTLMFCFANAQIKSLSDESFQVGDTIRISNLEFKYNSGEVYDESIPILDSLVSILDNYQGYIIEIVNHTDSRISNSYSIRVSDKRAKMIASFLSSNIGINNYFITTGYQDEIPLFNNELISSLENEQEQNQLHRKNRRTEIVFHHKNFNSIFKNQLGFVRGYSGSSTKIIKEFEELLQLKDYSQIKENLFSEIPANQYLAVLVLELLEMQKILELSQAEKEQIEEIKNSNKFIYFCSGCTEQEVVRLKEALNWQENLNKLVGLKFFYQKQQKWLDSLLESK